LHWRTVPEMPLIPSYPWWPSFLNLCVEVKVSFFLSTIPPFCVIHPSSRWRSRAKKLLSCAAVLSVVSGCPSSGGSFFQQILYVILSSRMWLLFPLLASPLQPASVSTVEFEVTRPSPFPRPLESLVNCACAPHFFPLQSTKTHVPLLPPRLRTKQPLSPQRSTFGLQADFPPITPFVTIKGKFWTVSTTPISEGLF